LVSLKKIFQEASKPCCHCLNCQIRFVFEGEKAVRERTLTELENLIVIFKAGPISLLIAEELEFKMRRDGVK
jgi:hypothetical protein